MKTAKEIREMLKESGKNVYIKFGGGELAHRVYAVRVKKLVDNYVSIQVRCLTHNSSKFFTICSTDIIYCQ